jgi:hypothetical protein
LRLLHGCKLFFFFSNTIKQNSKEMKQNSIENKQNSNKTSKMIR